MSLSSIQDLRNSQSTICSNHEFDPQNSHQRVSVWSCCWTRISLRMYDIVRRKICQILIWCPYSPTISPIASEIGIVHTAENYCPTMFHTAAVRPTGKGPRILYNTSLNILRLLEDHSFKGMFWIFIQISAWVWYNPEKWKQVTNSFYQHCTHAE